MATEINEGTIRPVLDAAESWMRRCWISDGSILSDESLWTDELIEAVRHAFVDHLDVGEGSFLEKLEAQMRPASPQAKRLMAEMLWVLYLFPMGSMGPESKRQQVFEVWAWSGSSLDPGHSMLSDSALQGVGSAGTAYNTHRWRELVYLISLTQSLKALDPESCKRTLSDYDQFMAWIDSVPRDGNRQFRHMLRYYCFPERVERMASNGDRQRVLEGFGKATSREMKFWTDRQFDDAMLRLRAELKNQHPEEKLDFYREPLRSMWRSQDTDAGDWGEDTVIREESPNSSLGQPVQDASQSQTKAVNLILYGPPGTGKTHWMRQKFAEYTDAAVDIDKDTWLLEAVASAGWRAVIAATIADLGKPVRVAEIRDHRWVSAKRRQRGRSGNVQQTLWGFLQEHTPEDSQTVNSKSRRAPFVFDKNQSGEWSLLPDWAEQDEESARLHQRLSAGPATGREAVKRYKVLTFHPSFSYEDFIRGIRPVSSSESGDTQFQLVDGKFKQICDEARANPRRRYALFIDEINRANIAKVFGELITLIEPDKRAIYDEDDNLVGGMEIQLPGGDESDANERPFGVPSNLDIYGTMNTADRSIALLDIALRRRFQFEECEPDYGLLGRVGAVDLGALLRRINDRLEYLLDRDHRIGHAYLLNTHSLDDLRGKFKQQIIPLLQEYFFDDFSRVGMVLMAPGAPPVVAKQRLESARLFPGSVIDGIQEDRARYQLTPVATWSEETFIAIYADRVASADPDSAS